MTSSKLLFSILLFCCLSLNAQNYYHQSYTWEKTPSVYVPTEAEKKSELVLVLHKVVEETAYDGDGTAVLYETVHNIYHVNSANAVDGVNKGYMSLGGVLDEVDLKARCITPQNKVIFYNKSTLKQVDNLEGAGPYKLFAIDGVEAGCDVEIMYTNKKQFSSYGYYYAQMRSPIVNYETRIITPKNLIFETKSYNGLEQFKSDVSDSTKNHLYLIQKNLPKAETEKYSGEKANNMAFISQFTYNTDKQKGRFYSWDIISKDFYEAVYVLNKNEVKALEKNLSKAKLKDIQDEKEKVRRFDSYFKNNFEIDESYDSFTFEKAIDSKKMSYSNGMRFYLAGLKYLEVPFELGITTERYKMRFDPKFASYIYTKEYLVHFTRLNQYCSPLSIYSRPGYPDMYLVNNTGLFIKEVNIGDISSASSKTKYIAPSDYKNSYHNTKVKTKLDFSSQSVQLTVEQSLLGYSAYYVQPIYRYLNEERKTELHKNYHLSQNSDGVKDLEVLNTEADDVFTKPMVVKYTAEQNDFLENAGTKYLFKAGLLIGPQAELYQEEKRVTPAEMDYPHYLERWLEIEVPAGYKATNLNDLIIEKSCKQDGKEVATFKSSYELKGNTILIHVYEDYQVIDYPLSVFDDFKNVINAAADFNKKTIVFEKL